MIHYGRKLNSREIWRQHETRTTASRRDAQLSASLLRRGSEQRVDEHLRVVVRKAHLPPGVLSLRVDLLPYVRQRRGRCEAGTSRVRQGCRRRTQLVRSMSVRRTSTGGWGGGGQTDGLPSGANLPMIVYVTFVVFHLFVHTYVT